MNLGRHELLDWINSVIQSEYTSVEMLADGIAYAQIIEAVHPGAVNATRLNLAPRYPDDCLRNLKLVEDSLRKLRVAQPASFDKIARGKFQDNIIFLQWLYSYANKNGLDNIQHYAPYERRIQILQKQGKSRSDLSPHLIPNQAYMGETEQWEVGTEERAQQQVENQYEKVEVRVGQLQDFVRSLESDLKQKMEMNWRLMHLIDRSIEERNTLYALLTHIETIVGESSSSPLKQHILSILHQTPQQFE